MLEIIEPAVTAILYLFAGRQTYWLMLLLDPQGHRCPITAAQSAGSMPKVVFFVFLALWPLLLLWGWACNRVQKPDIL